MSTWAPPPYPRRSRSRSPGPPGAGARGGPPYPPRPADYGGGPGYDYYGGGAGGGYERDRAWADYERERAAYDYGRRGRSRSPGADDMSRKRRRSASPYDSRYEPRPRFEDYDYGRYGRSPPRRHGPPDPHTFEYSASLKQYAEWFRFNYPQQAQEEDLADRQAEQEAGDGSKPRNGIRSRWEKYKRDFQQLQLTRLFDHHRRSPWFVEKYHPDAEYVNLRDRTRQRGWRGRLPAFLDALEMGQLDAELESDVQPASPTKEDGASAANGDHANGEGEDGKNDEDHNDEEQGADANGKPSHGSQTGDGKNMRDNRGEEISVPNEGNQVMIRTIPPDIGRLKLEMAIERIPGFVHLALGDPLQRRNFYRAGWIKFREDADMTFAMSELTEHKVEGFKLHVTHLLKPFSNRIKYAPEVASRPDRVLKDLENAKKLAAVLEAEYERLRGAKVAPAGVAAAKDRAEKESEALANGQEAPKQDDVPMTDAPYELPLDDEPEMKESGTAAVERRLERLFSDLHAAGGSETEDEKAIEYKKNVLALDLYLAYLRSAFHTCYYCAIVGDHLEELQRKCIKHKRKPMSKLMIDEIKAVEAAAAAVAENKQPEPASKNDGEDQQQNPDGDSEPVEKPMLKEKEKATEVRDWKRNDERWLDWLDAKVALLIDRDNVDPKHYGGKSYDEELSKAVEPHVKQEDEGKFRCKNCQKLFKAMSFVEKHIANKHPELLKSMDEAQLPYFNNFALDPHRLQPATHPPSNAPGGPRQDHAMAPLPPHPSEYGRGGFYPPPGYPAPYPPHPHDAYAYPPPYAYPPRRDDGRGARLSDRIGGFGSYDGSSESGMPLPPPASGLPAKPMASALDSALGQPQRKSSGRPGPPPPPPADAKEDPRAAAGRKVSYHDMDMVADGDVELQY